MEKIKHFIESDKGKDILTIIIVLLVGIASFELGRLSKDNVSSGIKVLYPKDGEYVQMEANALSILESTSIKTNISNKNFFASKIGSKYYPIDCSAGKNIKQENRIYFETREEAERAGFALSSSCN